MGKVTIDPQPLMYPMPVVLVGTIVKDKPNFMPVAWCSIVNGQPPMISVAIGYKQYTYQGIKENSTFSVNIPSVDMVRETDYCGIVHGSEVDKAKICRFRVFYGETDSAPFIEQCPLNIGCKVVHILDLGSNWHIIGRIHETHITESCLTDGKPDPVKIKPFTYARTPVQQYQALGEVIAKAFSIGKELKSKE